VFWTAWSMTTVLAALCVVADLETAIGWPIGVDMVRIGGAYATSAGLWG